MVRLGPRLGPTLGPALGPNRSYGGGTDPLDGFSATFLSDSFEDYLSFSIELDPTPIATGSGPFRLTTDGVLPPEYALATDYWFIKLDNNTGWLASSEANALASNRIVLTGGGSGTHTMTYTG